MSTITCDYELEEPQEHAAWRRTAQDEFVNAVTHGGGLMLALAGALVMMQCVLRNGDAWSVGGCGVFLTCLVAVYGASTLSHSCTTVRWKRFFRRLDQGCIYLLIVATYTPFGLAYWRSGPGLMLLAILWTIAIIGCLSKVVFSHRVDVCSIWSYVLLGWLPILSVPAMRQVVPTGTFEWILFGAACYMVGIFFLIFDTKARYFHAVWHVLVIAGSTCHYLGILAAVATAAH
jgi:hemolysin III